MQIGEQTLSLSSFVEGDEQLAGSYVAHEVGLTLGTAHAFWASGFRRALYQPRAWVHVRGLMPGPRSGQSRPQVLTQQAALPAPTLLSLHSSNSWSACAPHIMKLVSLIVNIDICCINVRCIML